MELLLELIQELLEPLILLFSEEKNTSIELIMEENFNMLTMLIMFNKDLMLLFGIQPKQDLKQILVVKLHPVFYKESQLLTKFYKLPPTQLAGFLLVIKDQNVQEKLLDLPQVKLLVLEIMESLIH
jgi:hypothetical protein